MLPVTDKFVPYFISSVVGFIQAVGIQVLLCVTVSMLPRR